MKYLTRSQPRYLGSVWILQTKKLDRRSYLRELATSKLVISPFGLGEITLKDFEVFMSGALLVKPDMSHMTTWPELFLDEVTMVAFDWDLKNLKNKIERALKRKEQSLQIASTGQAHYRKYLNDTTGEKIFVSRFHAIIEDGLT